VPAEIGRIQARKSARAVGEGEAAQAPEESGTDLRSTECGGPEGAEAQAMTSTKRRAPPKLSIPFQRFELSSGAVLLVSPRPSASIAAIQVHVRGGSSCDPVGREGTAFLTGALADQGTAKRSEKEIAAILEPEGGEIAGDTGGLSGAIVNERWDLLLELLVEMATTATYPAEEVARQKKRLLDRLQVEKDDARVQGGLLFRRLVYGDHWMGRPGRGTLESLPRIATRDLAAFRKANWVGKRMVIAVCGDVDPALVRRRAEKLLRKLPVGAALERKAPKFPPIAKRSGVFTSPRQQVHVFLGHLGIARNDPDYAALVVMDHVLGTGPGFTNRVSRKLRDEMGLAYAVSANIHGSAGLLPGMFTAYIGTSPEHVGTVVKGFVAEIRRMQRELVGKEELEVAKSYLLGSFPLGFERSARRSSYLVSAEVHQFPADHLERLLVSFAAVTAEDVRRVAKGHLFPAESCVAAAGPVKAEDLSRFVGFRGKAGAGS
jgi:zinc protease